MSGASPATPSIYSTQNEEALDQAPTQIFLHIQKTAGTSLRESLTMLYGPHRVARLYEQELSMGVQDFAALPPARRGFFRLIIGHLYYGLHPFAARPARYCTFMRDPLARVRSHFQQHLRAGTVFVIGGRTVDLVTVVNEGLTDEFDNLQLRMIGGLRPDEVPLGKIGEAELRQAVKTIVTMFGFIGVMERLAEDWPRLLAYLGLEALPLGHAWVTPEAVRAAAEADFQRIDWQIVKARHAYEIALYEFALSRPALSAEPIYALPVC